MLTDDTACGKEEPPLGFGSLDGHNERPARLRSGCASPAHQRVRHRIVHRE